MKVNYHKVLSTAVFDGFEIGWSYAHQYSTSPSKENVRQAVLEHIMNELEEWFVFEENENV